MTHWANPFVQQTKTGRLRSPPERREDAANRLRATPYADSPPSQKADISFTTKPDISIYFRHGFTNVSEEITGAKKLLIRRNAAVSSSGRWQAVASPITIGR